MPLSAPHVSTRPRSRGVIAFSGVSVGESALAMPEPMRDLSLTLWRIALAQRA